MSILNFRKLKAGLSANVLKEGRSLFAEDKLVHAKIIKLDHDSIRFSAQVQGNFDNTYESEIEVDRTNSETIDSNCDCPYEYDCQHIAALMFYLEANLDEILVSYSQEADVTESELLAQEEKDQLLQTFEEARRNEETKRDEHFRTQVLADYQEAASVLARSAFFLPPGKVKEDKAELAVIFNLASHKHHKHSLEFQLALRLPFRSKPLQIPEIREFVNSVRYEEPLSISGRRYFFTRHSFDEKSEEVLEFILNHAQFSVSAEAGQKVGCIEAEVLGTLLAAQAEGLSQDPSRILSSDLAMPCMYLDNLETPLIYAKSHALIRISIELVTEPTRQIFLKPSIALDQEIVALDATHLLEAGSPGLIYQNAYYRFNAIIGRTHVRGVEDLRNMTVPEPLFGTLIENALPKLMAYAEVQNMECLDGIATLPYVEEVRGKCSIEYLDGELEASLCFIYDGEEIPAYSALLNSEHIKSFQTKQGILARNLALESDIVDELFQGFVQNKENGTWVAKTSKKIVEFMTEVVPRNQARVHFECPRNLLDQFLYDDTRFSLKLRPSKRLAHYDIEVHLQGPLLDCRFDLLWECVGSKKSFIEVSAPEAGKKRGAKTSKSLKILILDLEKLSPIILLLEELGIDKLSQHTHTSPLWSLINIEPERYANLPITIEIDPELSLIRRQILGLEEFKPSAIPATVKADLRPYQKEGVHWLEKLRLMHLNGVLADDMGLGKTVQAICAMTQCAAQYKVLGKEAKFIVVCPTSLLYNWKEELGKFQPDFECLVVDGTPTQRKKLLKNQGGYDVLVTSYTLLQKDIEIYQETEFAYAILDEGQHIKNRGTRNAKSVKLINAAHRLILTGTPIENGLEELWSLFDYLMPGLLSSFDRFNDTYVRSALRHQTPGSQSPIPVLKNKVAPFILRRMKSDVLQDLPAISDVVYHCNLSEVQRELYNSYASDAREKLTQLVDQEGFDKVQIHVLATLTRLKQICCHPGIFAKESVESGDSSKYEMLQELLETLIEGGHRTVIFSQYTRMLQIMRQGLEQKGIRFAYLDGSTKMRQQVVKNFNEDNNIKVFMVSLKAGGVGLNLTGADTVIHYDMWWNPAVENQATDRVHRMGQSKNVTSIKLITKDTIEEKIQLMQDRKRDLVKKVVTCDDDAITKLTWDDVLELLKT